MSAPKLPAVRLTAEGECVIQDGVSLDLPPNNKFSISYAPSEGRRNSVMENSQSHQQQDGRMESSGSDNEPHSASEGESGEDVALPQASRQASMGAVLPQSSFTHGRMKSFPQAMPYITRTRSMPLPSQLTQLQHPHRPSPSGPSYSSSYNPSAQSDEVREVSVELADSIQLVIQTMLQISPPQVLDPAKEQFSACALSVPTSSMSAMFTAMKNINYLSANMSSFCEHPMARINEGKETTLAPKLVAQERNTHMEFDIGEMLQCVGDTLSGAAAQAGVDLVLYHGDVGLKHVYVAGDESAISFALSHIIRQVLSTAERGDSIEIGLLVSQAPSIPSDSNMDTIDGSSPVDDVLSTVPPNGPIRIRIRVSHKFMPSETHQDTDRPKDVVTTEIRPMPSFSLLLRRILRQIDGTLVTDLPPPEAFTSGTFGGPSPPSPKQPETRPAVPPSPNFIFIDDDVDILKERLQELRFDSQPQYNNVRKRPSLSSHHRPRSSPQIARLLGINNLARPSPVVIMHFTSLSNYKVAKDAMQSLMASYASTSTPLPEVMIIPKPAGPRRFLTAIYTAVTKPVVDPWFMPIATSPMSPSVPHSHSSFFGSPISEHEGPVIVNNENQTAGSLQTQSPVVKNGNRPTGSRSNSDRSTRSTDNASNISSAMPPSPLALPDNVEYFSAAAECLGASPSSGLVIQSPDGQTAGIYFHPRSKNTPKNVSSHSMERDRGQLAVPSPRRSVTPRVPSGGKKDGNVSFASLHQANALATKVETSPRPSPRRSPSASVSASAAAVSASLVEAQEEQSPIASSSGIVVPVPRRPSEDVRKISTPTAGSPTEGTESPVLRKVSKRERVESKDAGVISTKKGKAATGSDNVVPPISVLIVDDNPINQTILSTFMRRKKIKYDLANNGQEAVQKWRTGGFHLILMDIQMPVMDGIQATKEIRRLEKANAAAGYPPLSPTSTDEGHTPSDRSIPSAASSTTSESRSLNSPYRSSVIIVALTASSLQSDRVAALAAGCNDFLTKPVSLLWLNNKIIEWGSIKAFKCGLIFGRMRTRISASPRKPTSALEDNAAALALASPAGNFANFASGSGSAPRSADTSASRDASRSQSLDAATIREVLDNHPLKRKSVEDDTPKPSTPQSRTSQRECANANSTCTLPMPTLTSPTNANGSNPTSPHTWPQKNRQLGRTTRPSTEDQVSSIYSATRTSSPVQEVEAIHVPSPSP
ncbi:hypothetical protein CPB84DRAFT_1847875 [Gymnopilus junonius]|uniref:Response regulatory domain-containing protein n=1 Tax=Gymnopilus junonius TaxID=109634 RepID=A0A9P5NN90_GYMJU|nr:hypothetical protein CPB84DRAFT_1847875 [Gymnopilus junonius]